MCCASCGAVIGHSKPVRGRPRKYCDGCRAVDARRRYKPVERDPRACVTCGIEFMPSSVRHVNCSRRCKDRSKPSAKAMCWICGKPAVRSSTSAELPAHNACRSEMHGPSRYRRGCRCDVCRFGIREWWRDYRQRRVALGIPVAAGGRWIPEQARLEIYERDGWRCHLCNELVDPCADPNSKWYPTLDHLVPRSRGGSDDALNLRTAHRYCNAVRQDRPLEAMSHVSVEGGRV